ncbi:MAG: ATP-binding cassette domain-containing protein [Nostoc desertorum CM1-VF14]|jgi:ATPase subunit of ABC transporter with duplicated ATPase domains|nr:ATP-binding cassette domain-containing protein [Nostoc desertorum CM1-VF14]
MQKKSILLAENLGYELSSTRALFKGVHLSIAENDRIALVGSNGVGKSTLLKILAGQLNPTTGSITPQSTIYYLPQISTIKQEIKADTVLDFLSSVSEEWWNIEAILETQFNTTLDLSLPLFNLSGGELTKLFLAIGLAQEPKVLLLDEPTNHMDLIALESLKDFLKNFEGAFVIVSHKPFFLDQLTDTTWELTPEGVKVYGGHFSLYQKQKETESEAALRSHEVARKELKRAKASALQEQQRAAQSRKTGLRLAGSIPKIVAGTMKRKAEVTAGIAKQKHGEIVEKATQKFTETKVRTTKATSIQLEQSSQKRRNLIDIQGANLWVGERLLIENIQLHISSGDRIAITGANGSGKSNLAKAILATLATDNATDVTNKLSIELRDNTSAMLASTSTTKAVYLDQAYEIVNRQQTIIENMQTANPNLSYQLLRQQLGHFLFKYDDVNKPASVLSGGELARLAIAMISISKIDLLILDEPTNNLDIETVNQMVEGINEYQGALWVISHDLDLLSRIDINKAYKLSEQTFQMTTYLPSEPEQYYQELLI